MISSASLSPAGKSRGTSVATLIALALLLPALVWLVYFRALDGPFVFDDLSGILINPSIQPGAGMAAAFNAPAESTPGGRPLLNATLALNRRVFGPEPRSFRVFNLALHSLNGLLVIIAIATVLRRAVALPQRLVVPASVLAGLAWTLHPIQTESVTYIIQRAESLGTFFYLLSFILALRWLSAPDAAHPALIFTGLSLFLGGLSKEIVVTVPLSVSLVWFAVARRSGLGLFQRRWLILMTVMAVALVPMVLLNLAGGARAGSSGFGFGGITPWEYFRAQHAILFHYLRVMLWPARLAFDYGWPPPAKESWVFSALYSLLLLASIVGAVRGRAWALPTLGVWIALLPTSSVIPVKDLAVEHRCYLALAWAAGMGGGVLCRCISPSPSANSAVRAPLRPMGLLFLLLLLSALAISTWQRNGIYLSERSLWSDTTAKRPLNARAHHNLGVQLAEANLHPEAAAEFMRAIELDPEFHPAWNSLGLEQVAAGRFEESIASFRRALELHPAYPDAHANLAGSLMTTGRTHAGVAALEEACRLAPHSASFREKLAMAYQIMGDMEASRRTMEEARALRSGETL